MTNHNEFEIHLHQLIVEQLNYYKSNCSNNKNFPTGLCKLISEKFARTLMNEKFFVLSDCKIVGRVIHADSPDGGNPSHFWLQINEYYLDLTIKQFDSSIEYYLGKDENVILAAFKMFHNIDEIPFDPWDSDTNFTK